LSVIWLNASKVASLCFPRLFSRNLCHDFSLIVALRWTDYNYHGALHAKGHWPAEYKLASFIRILNWLGTHSTPFFTLTMHCLATLTAFIGAAAAAALQARDAPRSVKIRGISLLGSGCPAGTADVQVDATGSLFEATFSEYEVETGPGTFPTDWRKNCKLTINMEFDSGFQYESPQNMSSSSPPLY
jgi:hypothetical protein